LLTTKHHGAVNTELNSNEERRRKIGDDIDSDDYIDRGDYIDNWCYTERLQKNSYSGKAGTFKIEISEFDDLKL